MDIVFGIWADPGGFPDHGGVGDGALGAPVVGPQGLLEILETSQGLGAPPTANVVRIAAFQAALEQMDAPPRFWSRSFAVDPWATARTILRWRDELVDAGWTPSLQWANSRIADISAAADAAGKTLPAGLADRAAALEANLAALPELPVKRIRLIDPREVHSAGCRRLLDRLEACGVQIEEIAVRPAAPETTALGRLQRWMLSGGSVEGEADETITIATSASAALAAEITGQWFADRGDREAVLIAQDSDSHVLDHGLCGAGQARAGRSRPSAHRGSLQVLLLAFKCTWAPFDARALMELLVFPDSPIAPRASRVLAAALEEAPGRGGPYWIDAWARIEEAELAAAQEDASALKKARARITRWRDWADPETADPVRGIPLVAGLAICDRTISWATARYVLNADPLYRATATLANDVRKALVALNRKHLPRTLVERIIDQALDIGHANTLAQAEAACWRCVPHPGALWGPAPTVVWWNFRSTQEGGLRQPWTAEERRELRAKGCPPDERDLQGRAASAAWERAILNARDNLLLICGGLDAGQDEALHPLAHRIAPATERLASRVRIEDALAQEKLGLANADIRRIPVDTFPPPVPRARWVTPDGYAARIEGTTHSATSFDNLFSCQLMWALRHVARLRPGRVHSIPDANRLLGNLAHALARNIFQPGPPPAPGEAEVTTRRLLEELIDELAAPLRHPEFAADLSYAREGLPVAMAHLAQTLAENDLVVEATELQVSGVFEEALAVRGAIDLVARDRAGRPVVIDLKWTRSAKSRLGELKAGMAVQLATYGAMLVKDGPYRAGYFLLNQRQFATLAGSGLIGRQVEGERDFPATWSAILVSWWRLREVADGGSLVAKGVPGWDEYLPADLPIVREVRCDRCDYASLCRVRGLK